MTRIISYQKISTPGPDGTTLELAAPRDETGIPLAFELATLGGITYVAVPDDATLPEQPEGIAPQPVTLTPELRAQIVEASGYAQLVLQRARDATTPGPQFDERAALAGQQQLQALGLATDADIAAAALDVLAARRYEAEVGGTAWRGHRVKTDRESQGLVTGALISSQQPDFAGIGWKMAGGEFVTLDASDMLALAQAVGAHVQACFAREAELMPLVQADITADISAGWPE